MINFFRFNKIFKWTIIFFVWSNICLSSSIINIFEIKEKLRTNNFLLNNDLAVELTRLNYLYLKKINKCILPNKDLNSKLCKDVKKNQSRIYLLEELFLDKQFQNYLKTSANLDNTIYLNLNESIDLFLKQVSILRY